MPGISTLLLVFAAATAIAWALTATVRRYAVSRAMLDYPNDRSSHTAPTPRGGGLSIVLLAFGAILFLWIENMLARDTVITLAGGLLLVACMGWVDDRLNTPAIMRAAVYIAASAWAVYWTGGLPGTATGWIGSGVAVLAIAWLINLYNFMDGTDALAGSQGFCTASMAAIFLFMAGHAGLGTLCLVISAGCAGFLFWNWPPARIFMGDVGSCTLGFLFGALALVCDRGDILPLAVWLILLALFIGDASLTLIKRFLSGEPWYQAHRAHAYQLAVRLGLSHKQLSAGLILANTVILFPLSYLAWQSPPYRWWIVVMVYLMTAGAWLFIQIMYRQRSTGMETG